MNEKVYIETYGCQMNISDSETVAAIMQSREFIPSKTIDQADVIIINTCSVRDNAEQKIWFRLDFMKSLKRKNKRLKIGIIGCMAQRLGETLLDHPCVDFVAGPDAYRNLPDLVHEVDIEFKNIDTNFNIEETYSGIEPYKFEESEISSFVPITRGCNNFCSFCIVPYTRGRERSNDHKDILKEIQNLNNKGYKEIYLLGQNVNSYKFEQDNEIIDFPKLIAMVAQANPNMRIRFSTSHPKDISDELIETIANFPNICNHIHLPFQSGSNKVLKLMNRKYTREWYLERIAKIKSTIPNCGLSTDVFCGFTDESEQDFQETLNLMESVEFDYAFMFKYSERTGTYASKNLEDNISEEVKSERLSRLIEFQRKMSMESNFKDIGKTFEVLVEGTSKKSKDILYGRTEYNKVVVFPSKNLKRGDIVNVRIYDASSATLKGKIQE